MKLGRFLIAGMFATTAISTPAHAGFFNGDFIDILLDTWGVHEVTQAKLKECATDGVGGKIKCSNVKKGDVETLLCGREATGKEKLALYAPCPIAQIADETDLDGVLFMGVFDFETGKNACSIEPIGVELETAQVHIKDLKINQIEAIVFGEVEPYDFAATTKIKAKEVKKTDTILDGFNCASNVRTKSLIGEKFGVENDAVIESGKIKAGKVKDSISASDICDGIVGLGPDCLGEVVID
jgi:hypothetical protein